MCIQTEERKFLGFMTKITDFSVNKCYELFSLEMFRLLNERQINKHSLHLGHDVRIDVPPKHEWKHPRPLLKE